MTETARSAPEDPDPLDGQPLPGEPVPSDLDESPASVSPQVSETMKLIYLAQNGDTISRNAVFERYQSRLLRVIRMRMGRDLLQFAEPEDVLQETMITWVNKFQEFKPQHRGSLLAWLDRIARGKIRDIREKWRNRGGVSIDARSEDGDSTGRFELADRGAGPGTENVALELKQRFDDLVAELDERQRDLLVLKTYFDVSWEDVVAQLGFSNKHAAEMALSRARGLIAERMGLRTS